MGFNGFMYPIPPMNIKDNIHGKKLFSPLNSLFNSENSKSCLSRTDATTSTIPAIKITNGMVTPQIFANRF